MVGCMKIGRTWRALALRTYWGMGSEARKMVADRVKAKGGALRDRKTCLNLRLDNGRPHGVYVCQRCQRPTVLYVCVFCVIIGRMQHHSTIATCKKLSKSKIYSLFPCSTD